MREKRPSPDMPEQNDSLIKQQAAAAKIDFYLGLQNTFSTIADDYTQVENLPNKQRKEKKRKLSNALLDLYLIKSNGLIEEPFYDRYPDISAQCVDLLNLYMPALQEVEAQYDSNFGSYDSKKRMKIALQVAHRFRKLSNTQKEQLFETAGYTPSQSIEITRRLAKSTITTGVLAPLSTIAIASGSLYERESPLIHLGSIDNNIARAAIVASYAVQYGAAYAYSRTNHRLLEDPEVNNAPDIFPSVLYMLSKRFLPEVHIGSHDIDVPKLSTRLGTILPIAIQEPAVIASMFLFGPQVVFARNMIGGAITGAQASIFRRSEKAKNYLR